jgi:hypothetical protein
MGSVSFGALKNTLDKKVPNEGLLKLYNVVVILSLLYGCRTRPLRADQIRRTAAAEIRFLRWVSDYTLLSRSWSEEFREELKTRSIREKINFIE